MLAQHTDESFRADHVRFRNAGGAVVQVLMRSDFFAKRKIKASLGGSHYTCRRTLRRRRRRGSWGPARLLRSRRKKCKYARYRNSALDARDARQNGDSSLLEAFYVL